MKYLFTLVMLLTTACTHMTIDRSEKSLGGGKTEEFTLNSLLFAFIPLDRLPPESEVCPKARVETVDLAMDPQQILISVSTLGIFVPHRVTVTCSPALSSSR
jgi:hypothetical protein